MDQFCTPTTVVAFTLWLLSLLLNANETLQVPLLEELEDESKDQILVIVHTIRRPVTDTLAMMTRTLHNCRFCNTLTFFDDELKFWVEPRSTIWFSRFLLEQYDGRRWMTMFRMTKPSIFALAKLLKPHISKKNTKYRLAVSVLIHVACTLFKLTHGANLTICSEMFAIGRSTMSKILREVVNAINDTMRHEISWPTGDRLQETQEKFQNLCYLPAVVGAIDGMHVSISKPEFGAVYYFYFKSGGYTINCQAVVDSEKRFLDLYVGMPGSTNDSRMLRRSSLHTQAMQGNILSTSQSVHGFTPYLLGDSRYPLLPWLMVPHKGCGPLSVSKNLFNRKLRRGRSVVENAFGILKQSFRELLDKSELKVTFVLDVIICCAILHNVLLRQSHAKVEDLLRVLRTKGMQPEVIDEDVAAEDVPVVIPEDRAHALGMEKQTQLGVHLTTRRHHRI